MSYTLGVYTKQIQSLTLQTLQYRGGDRFYIFDLEHSTSVITCHYLLHHVMQKTDFKQIMTIRHCSIKTKQRLK